MYIGLTMRSLFPILTTDSLMRDLCAGQDAIRFKLQPNGTTLVNVQKGMPCDYADEFQREARGLVFDARGRVVCRPLHKFFNVNEKPETQVDKIDWDRIVRVMPKRDGSMINVANVPSEKFGTVYSLKSKAMFEHDVALQAMTWVNELELRRHRYHTFFEYCVRSELTPVLEWMAPHNRIVVFYQEALLELLHVRHNVTGQYLSRDELFELAETFEVPVVGDDLEAARLLEEGGAQALIDYAQVIEGTEGWVLQRADGEMFKLKTKWYMDRHHAMTMLRTRDIARLVVEDTLDDLKAKMVGDKMDIAPILAIENRVKLVLHSLTVAVEARYHLYKHLDSRGFWEANRDCSYIKLVLERYRGQEPSVVKWFAVHLLDELFDLEQINLLQVVEEAE